MIPGMVLSKNSRFAIAWATALLFAIHPMQVEAVAWISASKVVLYSFFYLLGMWFYLFYRQSGKRGWLVIVFLCFVASLLSKEQAVVFVLTLLLIDWAVSGKEKHRFLLSKTMWLEKIPFMIVALSFGCFTFSIQGSPGIGGSYPLGHRLLFTNYSFWEYLIKLTVPQNFSFFYFFPMDPGHTIPFRFWLYPLASGVLCWVLIEYRYKINSIVLFGGLFFLINIVLVLHVLPAPRATIISDRYVYLSSIGFFLMSIYGIFHLFKQLIRYNKMGKIGITIVSVAYLTLLLIYTSNRIKVWENMNTLNDDVENIIEKNIYK